MKVSTKTLKEKDYKKYIQEYHGSLFETHPSKIWNYYNCDNNTVLVENTKEKNAIIYLDKEAYHKRRAKFLHEKNERPLSKQQKQIKNIEEAKAGLITHLFSELNFIQPTELDKVDLKQLDKKIKLYGYEKAYYNLLLNLIVFCGEYIREERGGSWEVKQDMLHPEEFYPLYVDGKGRNYNYLINTCLIRSYLEKDRISIYEIILDSLKPNIFEIVPNPDLQNPNEKLKK